MTHRNSMTSTFGYFILVCNIYIPKTNKQNKKRKRERKKLFQTS